jgi:hypothetical protein
MPESLKVIWPRFEVAGKAREERGDDALDEDFEITTHITLRLPDGRESSGALVVGHFETGEETGLRTYTGVAIQLDTLMDAEGDLPLGFDVIDRQPSWASGWTQEALVMAFNIDPESPIWEEDEPYV